MNTKTLLLVVCLALAGCEKKYVHVDGVTLPAPFTIEMGEKKALQAKIWPVNAQNKNVSWKSESPHVATIDPVSGEITTVDLGDTVITATTDDGGKSAQCTVTVVEAGPNVFEKITDPVFMIFVEGADTNKNGKLSVAEAADVTSLNLDRFEGETKIKSLKGIEYFTGLTTLRFNGNEVAEIDLKALTVLVNLYCADNGLTKLDLSENTRLSELICNGNKLSSLDLSKNTALTFIHCGGNSLTSFDISKNNKLFWFNCEGNPGERIPDPSNDDPNRTRTVFVVDSWFDNNNIPSGKYSLNTAYDYYFSTKWTLADKTEVTVDYQKADEPEP